MPGYRYRVASALQLMASSISRNATEPVFSTFPPFPHVRVFSLEVENCGKTRIWWKVWKVRKE